MTDIARFEAFVREFQDMVFGTAVRLLGNPVEAEDVAQTVFLRAFERFGDLESSAARAGWLKTVTTNICLTHLSRYRARWQFFSEVDASMPAGSPSFESSLAAPATGIDPIEEAEQAGSESARLEQALQSLPDHQRVPLVLFHFQNQTYQKIATTLGCSVGKIKTDIFRGREALKRALTPVLKPEPKLAANSDASRKGKPAA